MTNAKEISIDQSIKKYTYIHVCIQVYIEYDQQ